MSSLRGVLPPELKISMFCVLSQNYQHFFQKIMENLLKMHKLSKLLLKNNVYILKQIIQEN